MWQPIKRTVTDHTYCYGCDDEYILVLPAITNPTDLWEYHLTGILPRLTTPLPTGFSLKLYRNHPTRSNGQTLYPILFTLWYPTLFLLFSEAQLHCYRVGSIYL